MELLDRNIAPEFKQVDNIKIIEAEERILDNNIPLYFINTGTQDLVKIELLFKAGNWFEPKRLVASAVNSMLNEGTDKHNAEQIADGMDYYGAFFQTENGVDWSSATLYTLTKYLDNTLPLLKEILTESVFPEKELETYKQNKKLHLVVDNERVDFIARKKFNEVLFGENHPYGYYATADDFDNLQRADLLAFFKQFYTPANCKIIVSGKVTAETSDLINKYLGDNWNSALGVSTESNHAVETAPRKKHLIPKDNSIQSAIRMGKILFNKTHPDYMGMQVLNTVFGGYFGSRLMTNIREDKGYTYGIGSAVASNNNEGYFFITTEIGVDVCQDTLNEIYFELKRLRTELIPEEELQLVKNYILGTFLRSIDGPFELADKFKGIVTYGLGYDYYHKFINTIKTITSEELRDLANKHLQEDSMIEVVVGK